MPRRLAGTATKNALLPQKIEEPQQELKAGLVSSYLMRLLHAVSRQRRAKEFLRNVRYGGAQPAYRARLAEHRDHFIDARAYGSAGQGYADRLG